VVGRGQEIQAGGSQQFARGGASVGGVRTAPTDTKDAVKDAVAVTAASAVTAVAAVTAATAATAAFAVAGTVAATAPVAE
jgi:hypothetical protein